MKWAVMPAAVMLGLFGTASAFAQAGPAIPVELDHVSLKVDDQARSIKFYEDVFGLKEGQTAFPPGGPRWIPLGQGASLHIQSGRNGIVPPPKSVHFSLAVPDIDAFLARLRTLKIKWEGYEAGVGAVDDRRTDHVKQVYIQDPDGYWIEVNDRLKLPRR
jgi:lactoylglutathione lyase